MLRERDTGAAIDPSRQTVAEFIRDEWLPSRAPTTGRAGRGHRGKVGIQTWDSYRGDLERHVIPRIGGITLQKLTPSDLNRLYDEIEQSGGQRGVGLAPNTIANVHGVIHKALADAVKLGKVARNVADAVEKPSAAKRRCTTSGRPSSCVRSCGRCETTGCTRCGCCSRPRGCGAARSPGWRGKMSTWSPAQVRISWTMGVVQSKPTWKPRAKSAAGERLMALDPGDGSGAGRAPCAAARGAAARRAVVAAIDSIDDTAWTDIAYPDGGRAQVAETTLADRRLIVRRTRLTGEREQRLWPDWRHHAFVTDRHGDAVTLDADHRRHAVCELAIRDLKAGAGLNHCPSGIFTANVAWAVLATLAHDLWRWTAILGGLATGPVVAKTLRRRYLTIPGRITRTARRVTLHLPTRWSWWDAFMQALSRLRAVVLPQPC